MSILRLYVDEDSEEHAVVDGLRIRGVDLLTTAEAGCSGALDPDQLAFAAKNRRAIYTFNAGHFARLHGLYLAQGTDHAGIIIIPDQRYSIGGKIKKLAELVATVSAEDMINRIEYL